MIIIQIDTSDNKKTVVGLVIDGKEDTLEQVIGTGKQKSQLVLPLIDELLIKHKKTLQDVTDLEVNTGPGSFTGLRVGIAIANTLAHALNLPINRGEPGKPVEAVYV